MSKKYTILCVYEAGGKVDVEANSFEEAQQKAKERLANEGELAIREHTNREFWALEDKINT